MSAPPPRPAEGIDVPAPKSMSSLEKPDYSKTVDTIKPPPTELHGTDSARNMGAVSWSLLVGSLLSSLLLFSLDNTIVADIQPSIISTLGQIDRLPWVSVGFPLGATSVTLFGSKLFSVFDNKLLFISGVLVFEIGSTVCGAAPSMTAFIFGRVICGVGATGIYVGAINILSVLTSEVERPLYLGLVGLTWGTGTVLGPVIGGAFADSTATWRWSFYLNLCVGAVAAPIYFFIVPRHNPCANVPLLSRILQLDFVGGILNAGAYTSLIMAVSFAGSTYNWNSSQIIGLFVCTGILWPLFFLQQNSSTLTTAEHRILPFSLLWVPGMVILFVQITIGMIITYIPMYFIPLFFQFSKGDSALMAAVRLLPFIFMQVFGTILNGATMAKFQYYMPWYLLGGILALIGGSLFYTVDMETQSRNIYGYSVILGLGSGLFAQASFAVSQAKVDARLIPVATALIGCGQITGVTFALTISSNIFQNRATQRITRLMPDSPRRTIQNAILGTDSTFIGTLDPIRRIQVLKAISKSIQEVYVMVIAASSLVIILSLMMKHEKLLKHHRSTKAPKEEDMAHA